MLTFKKLTAKENSRVITKKEEINIPLLTVYPKPPVELKGGNCKFSINNTLKTLLGYGDIDATTKIGIIIADTNEVFIANNIEFNECILTKSLTFSSKNYHSGLERLELINPLEENYFYATKLAGYGFPVCKLTKVTKEQVKELSTDINNYIMNEVETESIVENEFIN